jgi:conjugative relaxase-like TrwC/TraI family protein
LLTVAKIGAGQAEPYARYLEGRTQASGAGDYYLRDGERVEAQGRWVLGDRGAAAIGVADRSAPVEPGAFRALMAVRNPASGAELRRSGARGGAVCAIDATFSAPKSVSTVWALACPELRPAIERAHERAVDRAVAHAAAHVPMVRRRLDGGAVARVRAAEVIATSWRHTTARAVDRRAPDPQLHSHVLLHGAVRTDGRVVAIESRAWMVHQREVDAAYLCELAHELQHLGFSLERETGRGGRYFEIEGVPEELRDRWSSRHHQVREAIERRLEHKVTDLRERAAAGDLAAAERLAELERSRRLSPGEERVAAVTSRAAKNGVATEGDLDRAWWQTATEYGFDARSVETLRAAPARDRLDLREVDTRVLERLTEFDAVFTERDVRAAALTAGAGLPSVEALQSMERLQGRRELLALEDGRLTTRAHRALEHATVADADTLARRSVAPVSAAMTERQIVELDCELARSAGVELAPEQAEAIRVACGSRAFVVIEGQAGTGKSTALIGIARAHQEAGRTVIVTSTGALAAERLAGELRAAGVQAHGCSTVALQAAVERGSIELGADATVIHDEAALACTREQRWLIGAVNASGGRLIEVGDPRQSQPVGAGGLWSRLQAAARDGGAHVELRRIVRAQDPADRRDQALWRAGEHARALEGYRARGHLIVEPSYTAAEDCALEAAHADCERGRQSLIIAQTTNEHLDELNARAQAIRTQAGELGVDALPLRGRPYALRAGDEVQIRAATHHSQLGRIQNGTTAHVLEVDPGGRAALLQVADGRSASFRRKTLDAAQVRLAYVQHPFPAQGATSDTCHLICDQHATAEGTYVALTRAREHTRIYAGVERLELDVAEPPSGQRLVRALADRLGRSEPEMPSIALALAHEKRVQAEQARASVPDEVDRAIERLAELRTARLQLRQQNARFPADVEARAYTIRHELPELERILAQVKRDIAALKGQREAMGWFARHSRPGRELQKRLGDRFGALDHLVARDRTRRAELDDAERRVASWEAAHPGLREQLRDAEREIGALGGRYREEIIERAERLPTHPNVREAPWEIALRQLPRALTQQHDRSIGLER